MNCFKTHNKLTMCPLGKFPFAPSERTSEGWELTEPMVDVISKVTDDCLDPGGNNDKESRLV